MINNIAVNTGLLVALFLLFEDVIYKKIRNEVIFSAFILVIIFTSANALLEWNLIPVKVFLIRFLISGILGISLWYIGGWSAGDAKLFWLLSLFFPVESANPINIFNETSVFLINTFVPVIPILLFSLIYDSMKRFNVRKIDIRENINSLLKNISTALGMMLVSRIIYLNFFSHLPQGQFNLISMLIVFFIMSYVSKIFINRKTYILGLIIIVVNLAMLYLQTKKEIFSQIYSIGILTFIVILFRTFYESVLKYIDTEIVRIDKLKEGDLLSKEFIIQNSLDKGEIGERLGDIFMDGLTREQLSILRDYLQKNNIEFIERQRTFSFSTYIVFGYTFTYFTEFDNIILFIRKLINI